MKKLALLLAALSVASVSYAKEVVPEPVVEEVVVEEAVVAPVATAPVLKVTSVGQKLIVENTSGNEDIGEAVHLENYVGLSLGDNWTFDLMARKTWSASVDDWYDNDTKGSGMHSEGHRISLAATRHFENFTIGMKWRGEEDNDRLYIPMSYNFGMISGWVEPAYGFTNGSESANDYYYLEAEPVQLTFGPVQLAYYFEGEKETGDADNHEYTHQVRLRGTLYSNDVLSLGAEYRYQFAHEVVEAGVDQYENNRHIGVLSAAYNVTENLVLDTYYEYDFNKYHKAVDPMDNDYYGEFGLGWTYNF